MHSGGWQALGCSRENGAAAAALAIQGQGLAGLGACHDLPGHVAEPGGIGPRWADCSGAMKGPKGDGGEQGWACLPDKERKGQERAEPSPIKPDIADAEGL